MCVFLYRSFERAQVSQKRGARNGVDNEGRDVLIFYWIDGLGRRVLGSGMKVVGKVMML